MDSFPIELIEHILRFCTGSQFSRSSRVSTNWFKAKQNIERTDHSFWQNRCQEEIERLVIQDLNPYHKPLHLLDSYECKALYIKWFRTQIINNLEDCETKCSHTFRSTLSCEETVTALTVTGTLVITGHHSGRVNINDVSNNMRPLEMTRHCEPVIDLVAINLVGMERYELHKRNGYPTREESYSNHHHIISIVAESCINISLMSERNVGKDFQIIPLNSHHFLKGRVCRDMFAVSTKEVDICLFRLVLPTPGVVPISQSIKAELITTVSCRQVFSSANHWLGLFTFSDLKLNCFCHEFNLIACSDVAFNLDLPNKEKHRWKWSSINEIIFKYKTKSKEFDYNDLNVRIKNGFSFGDKIFFLITYNNETVFTTDAKTFHLCDLKHYHQKQGKIQTLSLFGSVLVCGTNEGYISIHCCPTLNRLNYITHFKPLFNKRICNDSIIKISVSDTGMGPLVVAATKNKVYLLKWTSNQKNGLNTDLNSQSEVEVITID